MGALLPPPYSALPSAAPPPLPRPPRPPLTCAGTQGTPGAGVRAPTLPLGASDAGTTIPVRPRATERPYAARGCGRGAGCGGDVTPRSRRSAPPAPRGLLGPVVGRSGPASSGPRRPRWMNYKAGGEEFRLFDRLPDAPAPRAPATGSAGRSGPWDAPGGQLRLWPARKGPVTLARLRVRIRLLHWLAL